MGGCGSEWIGDMWYFETSSLPCMIHSFWRRARLEHPIQATEQYWMHEEESVMGRFFTRKTFHLWRWDGERYDLPAEAFTGSIS
jgi:hypothetical protein